MTSIVLSYKPRTRELKSGKSAPHCKPRHTRKITDIDWRIFIGAGALKVCHLVSLVNIFATQSDVKWGYAIEYKSDLATQPRRLTFVSQPSLLSQLLSVIHTNG